MQRGDSSPKQLHSFHVSPLTFLSGLFSVMQIAKVVEVNSHTFYDNNVLTSIQKELSSRIKNYWECCLKYLRHIQTNINYLKILMSFCCLYSVYILVKQQAVGGQIKKIISTPFKDKSMCENSEIRVVLCRFSKMFSLNSGTPLVLEIRILPQCLHDTCER